MIEPVIYSRLNTDSSITSQIDSKLYAYKPAPGTTPLPYCSYFVADIEDFQNLAGPSDLKRFDVTVEIYTQDPNQLLLLGWRIHERLVSFRGELAGYKVSNIRRVDRPLQPDPTEDGYHDVQTFSVMAKEIV